MNRSEKLRALHRKSPNENSYRVRVPRKRRFLRCFTTRYTIYLTVYKCKEPDHEDDHWFVMLTNGEDSHNPAWGARAYGADFRMDDGEAHRSRHLPGAWESALTMWPVRDKDKAAGVIAYVAKVVDLAYEQHVLY